MARRNEKIKLGLPAYITFACILVAVIVLVLLVLPSSHDSLTNKFMGSYTVEAETQGGEEQTEYYQIGDDHVLVKISFSKFKRVIKGSKYTYVLFGDDDNQDFARKAVEINEVAKEEGIEKIYYLDTTSLSENNMEYIRTYLREVNHDIKDVELMPKYDLWVFKDNKMLNAISREEYTDLTVRKAALYHIFSDEFKN